MAHNGDPVLDKRGRVIGWVTSCAADMDGTLTGQAYVELKYAEEGTPIFVYQSAPQGGRPGPGRVEARRQGPGPDRGDGGEPVPETLESTSATHLTSFGSLRGASHFV